MPRLHTRARSQRAAGADGGRGGRRRGRGVCSCSGVASRRRLGRLLSRGSAAAAAAALALSLSLSRLPLQVRNLAGPCSRGGGGGARAGPSVRRAGRAAPRVTRLLGGPSPGGAGPPALAVAAAPRVGRSCVCQAEPVQGRRPSAPLGLDPPAGRPAGSCGGPAARRGDPSLLARPSGRPARCEVGLRKLAAGRGGAAHSWRRKGLSFGKPPDDVAGPESGPEGVGGGLKAVGRPGTRAETRWATRGPEPGAAGCGHRTRRRPRRGGRGPWGSPLVQSGTGLSNFPECGMRFPAPPGGGAAAPFPGGAARSLARGCRTPPELGPPGVLPGLSLPRPR